MGCVSASDYKSEGQSFDPTSDEIYLCRVKPKTLVIVVTAFLLANSIIKNCIVNTQNLPEYTAGNYFICQHTIVLRLSYSSDGRTVRESSISFVHGGLGTNLLQ